VINQDSLKSSISGYLARHSVLSLATCHDGQPWSTDLFYASDELCQLYFVSAVTTWHCKHIAANPRVSVSISRQCTDWKEIRGLQLDGIAGVVSDADRDVVVEMYLTKFPALKKLHQASKILSLFRESSFYRITPAWIRLIDNSKIFGHKEELIFDGG